jgi:hypothetical protein
LRNKTQRSLNKKRSKDFWTELMVKKMDQVSNLKTRLALVKRDHAVLEKQLENYLEAAEKEAAEIRLKLRGR